MNKRGLLTFLLAVTLIMPSFYPLTQCCQDSEMATVWDWRNNDVKEGARLGGCENVWIDKLNYSEYQRLKTKIRTSFPQLDAFGNPVLGMQQERMEEQGLSDVPGAERVKDKFIMTERGKLLLYNVQKKQVESPAEACQLKNVIVDGLVSYALRTDETIYCTVDEDCGKGIDFSGTIDTAERAPIITSLVNALYNNNTQAFRDAVNSDEKVRSWVRSAILKVSKEYDLDDVEKDVTVLSEDEKRLVVRELTNKVSSVVGRDLEDASKPPNRIRSNNIEINLLGPDKLDILVPVHLMQFIGWLATAWNEFDTVYSIAAVTEMLANPSSGIGDDAAEEALELSEKTARKGIKGKALGWWYDLKDWYREVSGRNKNIKAVLEAQIDIADSLQEGARRLPAEERFVRVSKGGKTYVLDRGTGKVFEAAADTDLGDGYKILQGDNGVLQIVKEVEGQKIAINIDDLGTLTLRDRITSAVLGGIRRGSFPIGGYVSKKKEALEKVLDAGKEVTKKEGAVKKTLESLEGHLDELKELENRKIIRIITDDSGKITGVDVIVKNLDEIDAPSDVRALLKTYSENMNELSKAKKGFKSALESFNAKYGSKLENLQDAKDEMRRLENAEGYLAGTAGPLLVYRSLKGVPKWDAAKVIFAAVGGRVISFLTVFTRLSHVGMTLSYIAVSRYNEYFQQPYFPSQVTKISLSRELRENISAPVYAETEIHTTWINQNVARQAGFSLVGGLVGMLSTKYTPDAPNFPSQALAKGKSLGKHVYIVDQVNPHQKLEVNNKNMILSLAGKFYFFSDYNDVTGYTIYEDPAGWTNLKDGMYTGIYWYTKNADIASAVDKPLAPDLVQSAFGTFAGTTYLFSKAVLEGGFYAAIPAAIIPVPSFTQRELFIKLLVYSFTARRLMQVATLTGQDMRQGTLVNVKYAFSHENQMCSKVLGDRKGDITYWKWAAAASLGVATFTNILPELFAAAGPAGFAVGVGIDLVADLTNAYIEMKAIEAQEKALKDMSTCLETDVEIASLARVLEGEDIAEDFKDLPKEAGQTISTVVNWLEGVSPEAGQIIRSWADPNQVQTQVLHDYVVTAPGEMHLIADRVYDAYFQRANVRWLLDPDCPISFCHQDPRTGAYKCMMAGGYFLLDEKGNPILEEPNPLFLSLGIDMDNGYAYMASKVIEIKKADQADTILKLYPDGIETTDTPDGNCLKEKLMSDDMLALKNVKDDGYVKEQLRDAMGAMDYVQTERAIIWPTAENEIKFRFIKGAPPKECKARFLGVATVPDGVLEFKNDKQGTIILKDSKGDEFCRFALGSDGAIVYTRGFIRPGVKQEMGDEAYDFTGVYHMFLTGYLAGMQHSLDSEYGPFAGAPRIENCTLPDGTPGFKFVWEFKSPDSPEARQWKDKAETMCITDGIGDDNNMFGIVTDPNTGQSNITYSYYDDQGNLVTDQYPVQGWVNQTPYNDMPGYQIVLPNGNQGYAVMTTDPQGNPQLVITDANGNPINKLPLMLLNGPNGGYSFQDGKVSLTNDFYFPLNPQFVSQGANGAAFMKPGKPPWGAPSAKPPEKRGTRQEQPFLALPSIPPGTAGLVFVALIVVSLAMAREYARRRED